MVISGFSLICAQDGEKVCTVPAAPVWLEQMFAALFALLQDEGQYFQTTQMIGLNVKIKGVSV